MGQNVDKTLLTIIGGSSSKGEKSVNQDAFAVKVPGNSVLLDKGICAVVADGLSCAQKAAEASQLAVTEFINSYYNTPETWAVKHAGAKVIKSLNTWLYGQTQLNSTSQWLTTLSAIIFKSQTAYLFHVGDCRISRISNGTLEHLTREHNHKQGKSSTVLTRAMGADNRIEVDYQQIALTCGDLFIISSDGFYTYLSEQDIVNELSKVNEQTNRLQLEHISHRLIAKAIRAGSDDNVTCLVIYISQIPEGDFVELTNLMANKVVPPVLKEHDKLDDFNVLKVLHHTTRSHIYLVNTKGDPTPKVMKVPSLGYSENMTYLKYFIQEAWVSKGFSHPNLMNIRISPSTSHFLYHISDFKQGRTLRQWMTENPAPELFQVQQIVKQLVLALRAMQRLSVVHRDIRPENVIIDEYGVITVIDYGSVQIGAELEEKLQAGLPLGTLEYSAPEYLMHNKADFSSDLYSLAIVAYEMLSGDYPYPPIKNENNISKVIEKWRYKSLLDKRPDLPLWLDLTLRQATALDPKHRYQAFSEFQLDFNTPNLNTVAKFNAQPFMLRDPILFWQLISLALFLLLLCVLFWQ